MKEANITTYTNFFNNLVVVSPVLVTAKYNKIERNMYGLPQPIQALVTASKQPRMTMSSG